MANKNITKLKILIITQYFWPENFKINEISEELSNLGHKVTVLTGYPNYPSGSLFKDFKKHKHKYKKYKNSEIIRIPIITRGKTKLNLFLNYLSFLLNSIFTGYFKLINKDFDVILTFQLSPITIGVTSAFFSIIKKCPQVFWVLDLWPDTLIALNILKKDWEIKLFKKFVNWIYKYCDIIIAQSESMLERIKTYPAVSKNAYFLPVWSDSEFFMKKYQPAKEINKKNIFTIMFAGNIGKAQDFKSILLAVKHLIKQNFKEFRIILIGDGSEKKWLEKKLKALEIDKYFELYKQYEIQRMPSFFLHADALLVSLLDKEAFNKTIPGKLQFYLSSGKPILGMLCGEGAEIIKKSKSGLVCKSGDYICLSENIKKITTLDKKQLYKMGINGKKYAEREFSKSKLIEKLNNFLIQLSNKKDTK